jgi:hypothetical protein
LKKFLLLDKEVKFAVISVTRLRTSIKNFTSDEKFIQYMLFILDSSLLNSLPQRDKNVKKVKMRAKRKKT